jgi:hypothetical protein
MRRILEVEAEDRGERWRFLRLMPYGLEVDVAQPHAYAAYCSYGL